MHTHLREYSACMIAYNYIRLVKRTDEDYG